MIIYPTFPNFLHGSDFLRFLFMNKIMNEFEIHGSSIYDMSMIYFPLFVHLHVPWVYFKVTESPAPNSLDISFGRALHWYNNGHGLESCSNLIFFQSFSPTQLWFLIS